MEKMHIAFCCDDNYIMPASIVLESLLKNCDTKTVVAHTFSNDLNALSIAKLREKMELYGGTLVVHEVPQKAMEIIKKAPLAWEYLSLTTYYRLILPYVLEEDVEKILYLDCDVLVRKNVAEFYDYDMGQKMILGVTDIEEEQHKTRLQLQTYINAGVLVMNMKLIRTRFTLEELLGKMLQLLQNQSLTCGDQDIINILFQDVLMVTDYRMNFQRVVHKKYILLHKEEVREAVVVHFITADKPWKETYCFPYMREYYQYLKKYIGFGKKVKYWLYKPLGLVYIVKKHQDYKASISK